MITLISRWKLRDGCSPDLLEGVRAAVADVHRSEPDTLLYTVHLAAPTPLDAQGHPVSPPPRIADGDQAELVFFEVYRDADAFARHLSGRPFREFRDRFLDRFYTDPADPSMPLAETSFLDRRAAFIREQE